MKEDLTDGKAPRKSIEELEALIRERDRNDHSELQKMVARLDQEIELEDKRQTYKDKQRAAIQKLLDATGGNIPELMNKVSEELRRQMQVDTALQFDDKNHLQFEDSANIYRLPQFSDSFRLDGSSDYFGMTVGEQSLLYERVGLFKGVIVDHSKETPVFQGFRDIIKKEPKKRATPAEHVTKVVQVFSRAPFHSGVYDSSYAFSERESKTQEIGITNFGISGSFAYSGFGARVAITGGYNYGKQQMEQTSLHQKKVYITSNFLLPKIELSFDHMQPCAADDFVGAIVQMLPDDVPAADSFDKLAYVLRQYGHFVPTTLLIGGKLYSTERKDISESSRLDNVVTEHQAKLQIAVETWRADAGVKSEYASEEARKKAEKRREEAQNLSIRAIGGEGAFVNDTARWVGSMQKFSAWNLIRFDDLIPSIDILPPQLRERCLAVLNRKAEETTIEDLLARGCEFLFYNGYYERIGRKAQPQFFYIQSLNSEMVLTINSTAVKNEEPVVLKNVDGSNFQLWWLTPDGKIVSKAGYGGQEEYVLTQNESGLIVTQNNYYGGQFWSVGGGFIQNKDSAKFIVPDAGNIRIEDDAKSQVKKSSSWRIVGPADIHMRRTIARTRSSQVLKPLPALHAELSEGYYIGADESLRAPRGQFRLFLKDDQLHIARLGGTETPFWNWTAPRPFFGIAITNGVLCTIDNKLAPLDTIHGPGGVSLRLQDNGNLELSDINNEVVWESKYFDYGVISLDENRVLTIYHDERGLQLERAVQLINQPDVKADHQLWYTDREGRIISKCRRTGEIRLALTHDDNNMLVLEPLNPLDPRQKWSELGVATAGPLSNKATGKKLKAYQGGRKTEVTDKDHSQCAFLQQADTAGPEQRMRIVTNEAWGAGHESDYFGFQKNQNAFFHLRAFSTDSSRELRGLQLYQFGNRLAVRAFFATGDPVESTDFSEDYKQYDNTFMYIDKAPIYTGPNISGLGLKVKGSNRIAFNPFSKQGLEVKNDEWNQDNYIKLEDHGFIDTNVVMAPGDARVIGFGFRDKGNRIAPYLLTIPH